MKDNDPEDIMNVIHLNDYVIFRKHLCIGFELMSMNLFEFLKINDFNVSFFKFSIFATFVFLLGIWPQFNKTFRNTAFVRAKVP